MFLNRSANPVTLMVAFPLPDRHLGFEAFGNIDIPEGEDPVNFVGFTTKIDGKPVNFIVKQQAFFEEKDITAELHDLQIPIIWFPYSHRELPREAFDHADVERAKKIAKISSHVIEFALSKGWLLDRAAPTNQAVKGIIRSGS